MLKKSTEKIREIVEYQPVKEPIEKTSEIIEHQPVNEATEKTGQIASLIAEYQPMKEPTLQGNSGSEKWNAREGT